MSDVFGKVFFFFSSRRRHTRLQGDWSSDVCSSDLLEKLTYLARGADAVVFAGSLPRDVDDAFYAEAIRELNRRNVRTVLDSEGLPMRLGVQAEPFLVSPNQDEAEDLAGQEFDDVDDFMLGLD